MTKEELRAIFIEEATEIIEKLDVDIINYEENPENKELLNELFRGVHTLKGSANSFGFTRLGAFVHLFEDMLDHYRDSDICVPTNVIDIFFNGVDVIKETMWLEVAGDESIPANYETTLEAMKQLLLNRNTDCNVEIEKSDEPVADLASEFADVSIDVFESKVESDKIEEDNKSLCKSDSDEQNLYKIILKLDNDIYRRGYDHGRFFQLLSEKGNIVKSNWLIPDVPDIETYDPEVSYWNEVEIYLCSTESEDSVEEVFLFVEPEEYTIKLIEDEQDSSISKDTQELQELKPDIQKQESSEEKVEVKPVIEEKISPAVSSVSEPKKVEKNAQSAADMQKQEKRSFVKIDTQKLDELFDSVGEMVIAQNFVAENDEIIKLNSPTLTRTIDDLSKITRLIQNRVMALRMVPVHDTFDKMKRVVRDASKKVNKEIEFTTDGEETEVDKTMVDSLSDPLIHIMRNAIDHGIEDSAEDRIAAGKSAKGHVQLRAYHKGGNIAIEVRDDGRGINREKVYSKALERGIISENDELSDQQVFALIMQAGFSTADVISDISGRGVGLDVVRSSIEKLQGKVEIDSKVGEGSVFTILLPLTLAIIDGMIVESAGDMFIVPTLSVIESFIPQKDIVHTARGKGEFVDLRGEMIPVIRLNEVLGINHERPVIWESTLLCVESEEGKYALLIDDLIGRQQVVIKTLGKALAKLRGVSGGAIMGNGDIALILNIDDLFKHNVQVD